MRELPAGPDAVLLDFATEPSPGSAVDEATAALRHAVQSGALPSVTDVIPSEHTVLVQAESGSGIDVLGVHRTLRTAHEMSAHAGTGTAVEIPVVYDGPDLADVATQLGVAADEVIRIHSETVWRVQFMGFAPGFGYLVPHKAPDHPFQDIGRRHESRHRVPDGSVAIAAGYSAVYPRESPGGWHLLGHTTMQMWDDSATPPAVLEPGALVRFVVTTDAVPS
ncbi:allophanate hydrolase subunit 1 [Gordonia sp. CPCC 206044]|uniref:5-oxoprolinase subunit B family protein n=1 Tax=Gordonia sp. CPCC 206044 TaxID=3140793 RepID=UPI003AF35764